MWRGAALLHENGSITFPQSCLNIPFGAYYVVLEHRNHLGVMSPNPVTMVNGNMSFDFTLSDSYVVVDPPSYGSKKLTDGQWVMLSGDAVKNTPSSYFDIGPSEMQLWNVAAGLSDQYRAADFNMDADINSNDLVLWKANAGKYSAIPH